MAAATRNRNVHRTRFSGYPRSLPGIGRGNGTGTAFAVPVRRSTSLAGSYEIVSVVESFNTALADGDGKRACAAMTPEAQASLMTFYNDSKSDTIADRSQPDAGSCVEAASGLRNVGYKVVQEAIADAKFAKVGDVQVREDEAQADSGGSRVRLVRVNGQWKISEPPGI